MFQPPPARPAPEFGKRLVRPAIRHEAPARKMTFAGKPPPGAQIAAFAAPGAVSFPLADRQASFAVAMAVASGLLFAGVTATQPAAHQASQAASAAVARVVVAPLAERAGEAVAQLRSAIAAPAAITAERLAPAPAVQPVLTADEVLSKPRSAFEGAGQAIQTAAHETYQGIAEAASRFVDQRIADGLDAAAFMQRELAPAAGQLSAFADRAAIDLAARMDNADRLAAFERHGISEPGSVPGVADVDARIQADSAALRASVENKIAAAAPPARIDLSDIGPGHKVRGGYDRKTAAAYAPYRVDGPAIRIGGEKVDAAVAASITQAAKATNNDPVYLASLASRESNFRPQLKASTSSATGLFQFLQQTWLEVVKTFGPKFGLASVSEEIRPSAKSGYTVPDPRRRSEILAMRKDPLVAATMASAMESHDRARIEQVLGRPARAGERYMAHFFGVDQAVRFLTLAKNSPNSPAADYFPKAAAANKPLFFARNGAKRSFTEVAEGFHASFDGPNGGMKRFQAFAEAAAAVAPQQRIHVASAAQRSVPAAPAAKKHAVNSHVAAAPPVAAKVAAKAIAATSPQAAATRAAEPPAAAPRSALSEVALPAAAKPAAPEVQVAALDRSVATAAAVAEQAKPEVTYVRTPLKPGRPASWKLGAGRIAGFIDKDGRLGSVATTFARAKIIGGFGANFSRLPVRIQDHLNNADQLDLNVLAPFAKLMPKEMRDGFAANGLIFIDAVAPSGGELIAVPVTKVATAQGSGPISDKPAGQAAAHEATLDEPDHSAPRGP